MHVGFTARFSCDPCQPRGLQVAIAAHAVRETGRCVLRRVLPSTRRSSSSEAVFDSMWRSQPPASSSRVGLGVFLKHTGRALKRRARRLRCRHDPWQFLRCVLICVSSSVVTSRRSFCPFAPVQSFLVAKHCGHVDRVVT